MPDSDDTANFSNLQLSSDAAPTMSTREIADLTGKDHRHVLRDAEAMLGALDLNVEGYVQFWTHPQNGQTYRELMLPKDLTITLISGYDVKTRHKIVVRWQDLEAAAGQAFRIPSSLPEALRLAADSAERAGKAEAALTLAAPKAAALDLLSASTGSVTFTQAAKLLSVKQADMTSWMNSNGWVYRQNGSWVAYKQHIENGRLEYKEANYTDQKTGMAARRPYCHITPKGLTKLALVFGVPLDKAA